MSENRNSETESTGSDSSPALNVSVDTTSDDNVSKDQNVEFVDGLQPYRFQPIYDTDSKQEDDNDLANVILDDINRRTSDW